MSYGYGLSVSLFQLARAYTAIAHDGELMPVTIFKTDPNQPITGTQVFTPTTAREVRAMLETVVAPGGTSPDAAVPGYRVGGKSGTAYKHEGRATRASTARRSSGWRRCRIRASWSRCRWTSRPRAATSAGRSRARIFGDRG
jgi:cell division protein FtsI/penicillin-binding protein 2